MGGMRANLHNWDGMSALNCKGLRRTEMITSSRHHRMRVRGSTAADVLLARERRRMAADVHDLIMQDLSFALATARTLMDDPAVAPQASIVVAAGERALAGAREVVGALASEDRKPVLEAVETVVRKAARNVPLSFNAMGVPSSAQPDQPTLDTLLLTHTEEWHLRIRDDGRGFDTANTDGGFGLESMRRHAQALGGSLHVTCAIGAPGTIVEAILP